MSGMTDQGINEAALEQRASSINEQVARKLGWFKCVNDFWHPPGDNEFFLLVRCDLLTQHHVLPPEYANSVGAAWELVEKKSSEKIFLSVGNGEKGWGAVFVDQRSSDLKDWKYFHVNEMNDAPTAICLAFLKLP